MQPAPNDRVANTIFVLCSIVLAGVAVARFWQPALGARAQEGFLEKGASSPFSLPAFDSARGVVLVFISSTCWICDESLPFYKRLAERVDRPSLEPLVVFVSMESESTIRAYLKDGGIEGARVASVPRPFGIPGTPCIVLIDRAGRVARSWAGRLSRRQERDVGALLGGKHVRWGFP